jgi:hypothetical protein
MREKEGKEGMREGREGGNEGRREGGKTQRGNGACPEICVTHSITIRSPHMMLNRFTAAAQS